MGYRIARTNVTINESQTPVRTWLRLRWFSSCSSLYRFTDLLRKPMRGCHCLHLPQEKVGPLASQLVNVRAKIWTKVAWLQRVRACVMVCVHVIVLWALDSSPGRGIMVDTPQRSVWRSLLTNLGQRWFLVMRTDSAIQGEGHWLSVITAKVKHPVTYLIATPLFSEVPTQILCPVLSE